MRQFIRIEDKVIDLNNYEIVDNKLRPSVYLYDKEKMKKGELSCIYFLREDFESAEQADTIEELCDEFVVLEYDNIIIYIVKDLLADAKDIFNNEKDLYPDEKVELYGAIWTDKGLIYVAKMNEKGDLELL